MSEHAARYRARQDAFIDRLLSQLDPPHREILWRAFRDDPQVVAAGSAALVLEAIEDQLAAFAAYAAVLLAERNAHLLDIGRRLDAVGLSTQAIAEIVVAPVTPPESAP